MLKAIRAIPIAAALLVGLTACNVPAKAETCQVYRRGVLVDVYCAVVPPVVDVIGEILGLPERILFGAAEDVEDERAIVEYEKRRTRRYVAPLK